MTAEPHKPCDAERSHYPSGEAGVVQFLKMMLRTGRLAEVLGVPDILHAEWEYPLPRGRADFALFHADGTATIVEAKAKKTLRDMFAGIGQLMSYTAQLGMSGRFHTVRGVLVAPLRGLDGDAHHLFLACERAAVTFVPIGEISEHEQIWAEAAREQAVRN
jgi:hypothetical protein